MRPKHRAGRRSSVTTVYISRPVLVPSSPLSLLLSVGISPLRRLPEEDGRRQRSEPVCPLSPVSLRAPKASPNSCALLRMSHTAGGNSKLDEELCVDSTDAAGFFYICVSSASIQRQLKHNGGARAFLVMRATDLEASDPRAETARTHILAKNTVLGSQVLKSSQSVLVGP